jgi:hypothetical protein
MFRLTVKAGDVVAARQQLGVISDPLDRWWRRHRSHIESKREPMSWHFSLGSSQNQDRVERKRVFITAGGFRRFVEMQVIRYVSEPASRHQEEPF